jgi:murein DD-endopeptidase MepM/ murein hydrolase activator NlpD
MTPEEYNAGRLTAAQVAELVRHWQASHRLAVDGMAGPLTIASINAELSTTMPAGCWPLRTLADGRKPVITSQFRRPSRPNHPGVDIFYPYVAGDPPMKIGDGGREKRWWIPEGTCAIAVADGTVVMASKVATGYRVWLAIGNGYHAGYFHLSELRVAVGERVLKGAPLGVIGDNPIDHDADHLHFELHAGSLDAYPRGLIDPEALLGSAPYLAG